MKILKLTKGFSSLFRRAAVLFIMPHYLKLFHYSLNVSDKICNYVVKPLIKCVTTEGALTTTTITIIIIIAI